MGTLCKNCPVRNIQKETGEACTVAFATRYGNSCVNLDITQRLFKKELEEISKETEKAKTPKDEEEKKERKPRTTKKKETKKVE